MQAAVDQQKAIQEKAAAKFAIMQRHRLLEALVAWSLHCKSCKVCCSSNFLPEVVV